MRKNILIFFCFLFVIAYFFADYLSYEFYKVNLQKELKKEERCLEIPTYFSYFYNNYGRTVSSFNEKYKDGMHSDFRKSNIINNTKKPSIIVFGCSFAYGSLLNDNQTFSSKLSSYSKRNVYNRALDGCGIQHMYYLLQDEKFFEHISPNPDYVIYVYIENQLERLNATIFPHSVLTNGANIRYGILNDKLVLKKENLLIKKSFIYRKLVILNDKKRDNRKNIIKNSNFELANKLFLESKKILEEKYPNIKFVILKYDYNYSYIIDNYQDFDLEKADMWNELAKEGFIVLNTKDIIGEKFNIEYTVNDRYHPNEKAWDLLVPKLVERLKL